MPSGAKRITEIEYCFSIPREKIALRPIDKIGAFELTSVDQKNIWDILLERETVSLKSEKIGVRLRRIDEKKEFTYKRFLGLENGATKYEEVTEPVSDITFNNFLDGRVELFNKTLKDLSLKGVLYPVLIITNRRKVAVYKNGSSTIEVEIEDLDYSSWQNQKTIQDAMLEVEILQGKNTKEIGKFVNYFKQAYSAVASNEGKNTRASRLLGIVAS